MDLIAEVTGTLDSVFRNRGVKEENQNIELPDMGIYVYVQLIHFVIKQKLTYHCKATILQ